MYRCHYIKFVVTGTIALLLSACQPKPEAVLTDYQQRLSRVLQLLLTEAEPDDTMINAPSLPDANKFTIPSTGYTAGDTADSPLESNFKQQTISPLPAIQQLYQPIPDIKLSLRDAWTLKSCGLQSLLAEKNNSLGKVMPVSGQLQYVVSLLNTLPRCIADPALPAALKTKLIQVQQQKQQQLPLYWHNLLNTDQTLRQQLFGSQRSLRLEQGGLTETLQGLQQLQQFRQLLAQQRYAQAQQLQLNSMLAALHQSQLLADLQASLRAQLKFFSHLNRQIYAMPLDKICRPGSTQAQILDNVLTQIFIGRVQPYLAQTDRIAYSLLPELTALYQDQPLLRSIEQRLNQPAVALRQTLQQHVGWWRQIRQHCALDKH